MNKDVRIEEQNTLGYYRVRASRKARAHYITAGHAARYNTLFGVPVVVLSTIAGTSVFASLNANPVLALRIVTGMISIAAAALAALQTFFRWSEQAEKHRRAGDGYSALVRDFDLYLLQQRQGAVEPGHLTQLIEKFGKIDDNSPNLPDRYYDQARQEERRDDESLPLPSESHPAP